MTNDEKKVLWNLYGKARAAQRQGADYQQINKSIIAATGGKVAGIASLEKALGIGDPKGRGEKLRESVAHIADKAALGYGGEIRGAIKGAGAAMMGGDFGETYGAEQAQFDALAEGAAETSPLASKIGTAAGFGANAALMAGAMPARAGMVAARGSAPLRAQILGGAARGAVGGAAGGALEGGSDPGTRMGGAAQGAMWGAAGGGILGGLIPGIAAGVGAGASRLSQALPAAERKATGLLGRALDRAKVPPSELPRVMGEMPEGSMVGDISGSMRRSARAARNVASELDDDVVDVVARREHGRGQRIATGLRERADLPAGYDPEKVFQQHRTRWLNEHVEPLYPHPTRTQGLLDGLADNKQMTAALKRSGIDPEDMAEEVPFEKLWATRQELKRQLRDMDLNNYEKGQAQKALDSLEGLLEDRVPAAQALFAEYARIKDVEELYDIGRQLGSGDATLDLTRALEKAGDDTEKLTGLRQGLVSWFEGKLLRKGPGSSVAQDLMLLPPRTRAQLRTLFGEDKLDDMVRFIGDELEGRELRWSKLTRALQGNSTTPQQLADMQDLLGPTRGPTVRDLYNRIWTAAMTNVDFSRDVAYHFGRQLMTDFDDKTIRLLTDTMVEMAQAQGLTARGIVATGAAASEYGPGLFDGEEERENSLGFTNF